MTKFKVKDFVYRKPGCTERNGPESGYVTEVPDIFGIAISTDSPDQEPMLINGTFWALAKNYSLTKEEEKKMEEKELYIGVVVHKDEQDLDVYLSDTLIFSAASEKQLMDIISHKYSDDEIESYERVLIFKAIGKAKPSFSVVPITEKI